MCMDHFFFFLTKMGTYCIYCSIAFFHLCSIMRFAIARKLFSVSFMSRVWDFYFPNLSSWDNLWNHLSLYLRCNQSPIINFSSAHFLFYSFLNSVSIAHVSFFYGLLVFLKSWLPFVKILLRISQRLPQLTYMGKCVLLNSLFFLALFLITWVRVL